MCNGDLFIYLKKTYSNLHTIIKVASICNNPPKSPQIVAKYLEE